ncbi:MAG: Vitamin B12 dependent methionine synthase activation subunit [Oscillospiraceae bacterium]|nr:Vitamin B12 dependent methionine synthase activation subunit [Oscillospiraceae bacterium]
MSMIYIKSLLPPPVNKKEILRYAGAKEALPELEALLEECLTLAEDKLIYKVCYTEVCVKRNGDILTLDGIETSSKDLQKNLAGCERAVIFAATVGLPLDRLIARFGTVAPSKALMLQAIGAERIESLCDAFNDEISKKAKAEGEATRPRFSPGYGDLPLELQKDVFALLDCQRKIGLTLNKSLLMSPSKSVTAVIGIGKGNCNRKTGCEACNKTDCLFRGKNENY